MENTKVCAGETKRELGSGTETIMKKPLVLSSQRWNSILKHLKKDEEFQQQTEQERKYREYLKEGSREMTKTWTNAIEKSTEYKAMPDIKKRQQKERLFEGEKLYKELKEKDARIRQEQISKAQNMIQRLKPGPRDLESAAMLCEVLKGRDIQRNINADFSRTILEHKQKEDARMQMQAIPWIEEEQRKITENRKRNEEYKNELIRTMKDEERRRAEYAKRQTEVERRIREQADKELKAQIERERAILQRKKEAMRKNALEAMKMVEQRRMRDKLENEIDNQIIAIFTKGKQCINNIKKEKEKILREDKIRQNELHAQKVFAQKTDDEAIEEQRIQKAVVEISNKLDQQEREKVQKEKMMKAARIKFYMEELERQKMFKAQKCEQFRWDMANRFKNEEINEEYERLRAQEKMKKAHEIRAALFEQMKEKQINEKFEKEMDQKCPPSSGEEDKFFMQYANKLIEDAKKKSRPILPLIKAVEKYKKDNEIDVDRQEPKHLKSNVPINENKSSPRSSGGQPIIKYDLNELKQLNPCVSPRPPLWA